MKLAQSLLILMLTFSAPVFAQEEDYALEDVVVGSSRINLKQEATRKIKPQQKGQGARPSLDSALQNESTIQVTPTPQRGANVSLDGMSGERVAITVESDPVIGRLDGGLDPRNVGLGTADQISVYHGLDSLPYGSQNIAGVISLESPWELDRQIRFQSAAGSLGRTQFSGRLAGNTEERWNYAATFSNWRTESFRADSLADDTTLDASARLSASVLGTRTEAFRLNGQPVDLRIGGSGFHENSKGVLFSERNEANQRRIHVFSDIRRVKSKWHFSYSEFRREYNGLGSGSSRARQDIFEEKAFRLGPELQESVGNFTVLAGSVADVHSTQATRTGSRGLHRTTVGSHLGGRYTISENWVAGVGSRYDSGPRLISPRAELQHLFQTTFFDHATLAETGMGFREASSKEQFLDFSNSALGYRVVGNPELQNERSWTTALRHTARSKRTTLKAAVFQVQMRDAIAYQPVASDPSGATFTYGNLDRTTTYGAQGGGSYRFYEDWEMGTSYQWLRGVNRENSRDLFLTPSHRVALNLGRVVDRGVSLLGQATWTSRQGFFDFDRDGLIDASEWAQAYWVTNAELGYGFRWQGVAEVVKVFARVDNALDVTRPQTFPVEPRTFLLGAAVDL
ncbi:MAG: TonB-dependent receptor [Bdellovibrionota bacterium]